MKSQLNYLKMIVLSMIMLMNLSLTVQAEPFIYNTDVNEDQIQAFLGDVSGIEEVQCTIGQTAVDQVTWQEINEKPIEIETYFLIDNSLSINSAYREQIKDVFLKILDQKLPNEKVTVATFDEELHYLAMDSADTTGLKNIIKNIQHQDLETRLKDVLYDFYKNLDKSNPNVYRRVIISSDGMESSGVGVSADEMIQLVKESGWPISIIGATYKDHTAEVENMFRIARETKGQYFLMKDGVNTDEIAALFQKAMNSSRVCVTVPNNLGDGSVRGVKLDIKAKNGSGSLKFSEQMPFLEAVAETEPETEAVTEKVTEEETEEPTEAVTDFMETEPATEAAEEEKSFPVAIVAVIIVIVLIVLLVGLFIVLKNKKKNENVPVKDDVSDGGATYHYPEYEPTVSLSSDPDRTVVLGDDNDGTLVLNTPIIRVANLMNMSEQTEISVSGEIIIGRDRSSADIAYPEVKTISRKHCALSARNRRIYVRDLGSANGTFVDGRRIYDEEELVSGSVLKLGKLELRIDFLF